MMKSLYKFIVLFLVLISFSDLNAQVVQLKDSTRISQLFLNDCGKPDTFTTFIRVASGSLTGTVELFDTFPSEFVFVGVVPSPAISGFTNVGGNIAKLTLNPLVINAAGSPGLTVKYLLRAKCGANGLSSAVHKILLTAGGGFSENLTGKDFVSGIVAPTIILESKGVSDIPNASVGSTYDRNWRIRNTGINSTLDTTIFRIRYQQGVSQVSLTIDGSPATPFRTSGDTFFYRIVKSLRNQAVYTGDTISIVEKIRVNSCPPATGNSGIAAYWGCYNTPICDINLLTAATQVPLTVPNVSLSLHNIKRANCGGNFDTLTARLVNSGPGGARTLNLDINQGWNGSPTSNTGHSGSIGYWDTSRVFIKYGINGTLVKTKAVATFSRSQSFWPAGNKPVRITIGIDSLKANDTIYVVLYNYRGCVDNSLCYTNQWHQIFGNLSYKNVCRNIDYFIPNWVNLNTESRRVNFIGTFDGNRSDMRPGDTVEMTLGIASGTNDFRIDKSQGYFAVQFQLPSGIVWDLDTNDLWYNGLRKPDSVFYSATARNLQAFWKNNGANPMRTRSGNEVLKPKFYLDCSIPGSGGAGFIVANAWDVENPACGCVEPYFCNLQYGVNNHCPAPCPRGGVVPFEGKIERVNLGLPDNNEDGFPDATGTIDKTKIEINKVMLGDTFKTIHGGRIVRGSQSPSAFTHAYGETTIQTYGSNITIFRAIARVKDASTGVTYNITNLPVSQTTSGTTRVYKVNYSPSSTTGYPSGFIFDTGDSIWVESFYRVTSGFATDNGTSATMRYYVAPYASPTNDTAKYMCDYYSPNLRVVRIYTTSSPSITPALTGCNQLRGVYNAYVSIGECCSNYSSSAHFRYEYRYQTNLDSMRVILPPGFTLDSAYIQFSHTRSPGQTVNQYVYGVSPSRVNGNQLTYNLRRLYTVNGGTVVPSKGGEYVALYVFMRPSCGTNPGRVYGGSYSWFRNNFGSLSGNLPTSQNRAQDSFTYLGPNVSIANKGANTALGIGRVVTWDVRLQNASTSDNAENTWIGYVSPNGNIIVDSIRDLTTNNLLVKTGSIFQVGSLPKNGVLKDYRLYARYTACSDDSITLYSSWNCTPPGYPVSISNRPCQGDSVRVYLQSVNPLIQTSIISEPSGTVDLCDTLEWVVSVSSRQLAAAYDITLDVLIPGGGLGAEVVPTFGYKYPYNVPNFADITPIDLGGGVYRFYLSDSIPTLKANGLRPIGEEPLNEIYVKLRILTDCDFTSGTNVRFIARGKKSCGANIAPDAEFSPVNVTNAPAKKLLQPFIVLNTDTLKGCNSRVNAQMKLINYELNGTTLDDLIRIQLVEGIEYIPGTNFTRNAFPTIEPIIDTVANAQRLTWRTGTAIGSLDSSEWSFNITTNSSSGNCGATAGLTASSLTEFSAPCATVTGGACTSTVENRGDLTDLSISKPDLSIPNFTAKLLNFDPDHTYDFTAQVENASTAAEIAIGDTTVMRIYFDGNKNLTYDVTDPLMGTFMYNYGFRPGQTQSLYGQFQNATKPDSSIAMFAVLEAQDPPNCMCNDRAVSSMVVGLPVGLLNFEAVLFGEIAELKWETISEINNEKFEIERMILGESGFKKIGELNGAGTSNQNVSYNFNDDLSQLPNGTVFYRLKQIDFNGNYAYSKVEVVHLVNGLNSVVIYPNPAKKSLNIKVKDFKHNFEYIFINSLGQEVQTGLSSNSQIINVSALPKGPYHLNILINGQSVNRAIVILE